MEQTTIPYEFTKYGRNFTQILRNPKAVMYKISHPERADDKGYEVMLIQNRKETMLGGRMLAGGEALPSSSMWGIAGWSFLISQYDEALAKFQSVSGKPVVVRKPIRRLVRRK